MERRERKPALNDPDAGSDRRAMIAAVLATAATIVAACIPLLGGAFRPVSAPSNLEVHVGISVVAHRHDASGGPIAVADTYVRVKNISRHRLVFFGSIYSVQGYWSQARASATSDCTTPPQDQGPVVDAGVGPDPWPLCNELSQDSWSGRYECPFGLSAIETGYDVVTPGNYLEPGQTSSWHIPTPISTAQFNSVRSYVSIATAYEDRLRLGSIDKPEDQRIGRGESIESSWDVAPTGWVADLTRGTQELHVWYGLHASSNVAASACSNADAESIDGTSMTFEIAGKQPRPGSSAQYQKPYSERVYTFYGAAFSEADDWAVLDTG